ncbi:apolipoprotein D [Lingula anatina]|uniref:Apolipoprotein D n=1 Tax=Lingula anatina TaxID=7574 RepID=A0A1S3K260_LINAN|nr:apolipoprotein D [Lingula anatina]|eukprot:XP_013416484.1 apolipoprotein D [Lingula anatina]
MRTGIRNTCYCCLLFAFVIEGVFNQVCLYNETQIQEDFELFQYTGTWFEFKWIPPPAIAKYDQYVDYTHTYQLKEDGNIQVDILARERPENKTCLHANATLLTTGVPGKLLYKRNYLGELLTSDYWIIHTDYSNYALAYGCQTLFTNGSCEVFDVWVWSRRPTLSSEYEVLADGFIRNRLCLDPATFDKTSQKRKCLQVPTSDAGRACALGIQMVFLVKFLAHVNGV